MENFSIGGTKIWLTLKKFRATGKNSRWRREKFKESEIKILFKEIFDSREKIHSNAAQQKN